MAIYQLDIEHVLTGHDPYHTIINFGNADTEFADCDAFWDVVRNLWQSTIATRQALEWSIVGVTGRNVSVAGSPAIPLSDFSTFSGALAGGNYLPPQTQFHIGWYANTERPNRGGTYFPCFTEVDNTAGKPSVAVVEACFDFATDFVAIGTGNHGTLTAAKYRPCIARFGTSPHRVIAAHPVSRFALMYQEWASLRRRRD